jgi:hypothetical protein
MRDYTTLHLDINYNEYTIFTISANIVKLNTINAKEMPFNLLNIIFTSSTNIVKKKKYYQCIRGTDGKNVVLINYMIFPLH